MSRRRAERVTSFRPNAHDSPGSGPISQLLDGPRQGRPSAATRAVQRQQECFGVYYLGNGLAGIASAAMAYELVIFLATEQRYSQPCLVAAAWLVVTASFLATLIAVHFSGQQLTNTVYGAFLIASAGAVALDLVAVADPLSAHTVPTAAVAVAVAHSALIVHRRGTEVLAVAIAVAIAEVVTFGVMGKGDASSFSAQVSTLVTTLAPAVVVVVIMRSFQRMVQLQIDRALIRSTTVSPHYAVGMLASEELVCLDLAAESLLAKVGNGSITVPLDTQQTAHAASLATQLRLHLVKGRRETWLYHAVLESQLLAPLVTLRDPDGSAGLLSHHQRDRLLSAMWLIADGLTGLAVVLYVEADMPREAATETPRGMLLLPLTIRCEGAHVRGVDPAAWEALAEVGAFRDVSRSGGLHIEIDCLVENPADR
ncbi:hypothetical protein [Rathayibacter toxicus]|uniref:hypothetical protein n=1 Tax=Rathayibacter toxicus TaxID=145458 RepID=UPI000A545FAE|nr:hypothetical protein [Rathayibacter toxicus]PPG45598.1 hypothetical protein C5D16_08235 [Rathayibacter toxicus]PPI48628.1 hypothetical protein C5C66_08270 [Rathayibacter toxicus]QOD08861.1 hypothetical protein AYW78_03150 [Rathayibacter toxicus]QWL25658.1 hypothetical protein E2R32_03115 [Rathayibacter toxicus]QWL31935.1 hypothetical protein E2R35_03120 [Rathayibacter toxicus]